MCYYDMYLYYIIISIVLFILIAYGYNKIKYKFWVNQPVFYRYNILNWVKPKPILLHDGPKDTIHLNFLNNNVSYATDTNTPVKIGNIYANEVERSSSYYDDIMILINNYPYFNKKYNNGNIKFLDIIRQLHKDELKLLLLNHDYNPIITMNYKTIYKSVEPSEHRNTDVLINKSVPNVVSVNNVVGVIISIPLYCFFKYKNSKPLLDIKPIPIYFSQFYYNSQEITEIQVTEMIQTYNYKMYHDWDEMVRRERDFIQSEKHEKQQKREIKGNSPDINKNAKHNQYQENGLKIVRNKEKIVASIFKYTVINVPKIIVPFVEYHSFYIPLSNWNPIEYIFHPSITLVKIGTQNINIFIDFLHSHHYNNHYTFFEAFIVPSIPHIMHMVKCEIYSIYILLQKNNAGMTSGENNIPIAVYMFRKSNKRIMNNSVSKSVSKSQSNYNDVSYLPCSIQLPNTHDNFFICGFINALKIEKQRHGGDSGGDSGGGGGCILIDTLSHNKKLIDYFLINIKPILVEKNTLLFHNYICKTLLPENVAIMN